MLKYLRKNPLVLPLLGLGMGLGWHLVKYPIGVWNILSRSYLYECGEGYNWLLAQRVSQGISLYQNVNESIAPVLVPYFPVYFLVCGGLTTIFGSSLLIGRLVSIVAIIIVAFFLYKIVNLEVKSRVGGIVAAVLVFCIPVVQIWTVVYRVDTLALMFAIIGIYLALKFKESRKILWSVPLFLLAILTKQSAIAAPLAVGIYLLIKERKLLYWYLGVLLGGLGIILLSLNLATDGQFLLHTIFQAGSAPLTLEWGQWVVWAVILGNLGLFLVSLGYLGFQIYRHKGVHLLLIYPVIAALVLGIASCKLGSYINYGLELLIACCILSGIVVGRLELWGREPRKISKRSFMVAVGIFLLLLLNQSAIPRHGENTEIVYQDVSEYIQETPGPIISEDMVFLLNEGRDAGLDTANLIANGLDKRDGILGWDQSRLVGELEKGYYSLVILSYGVDGFWKPGTTNYVGARGRMTEEMARAILDRYELVYFCDKGLRQYVFVYKPK